MKIYEALKAYKVLLDTGAITQEEFESKKKELLGMSDEKAKVSVSEPKLENYPENIDETEEKNAENNDVSNDMDVNNEQIKLSSEENTESDSEEKMEEEQAQEQATATIPEDEKKKSKGKFIILGLGIVILIVIAVLVLGRGSTPQYEWPNSGLALDIPKPELEYGQIDNNSETSFDMYVFKASVEEYDSYVEKCKEKGFTVNEENDGMNFSAYNADKTRYIDISYYEDQDEWYTTVRAPEEMTYIYWPKSELAKLIPQPKRLFGTVNYDHSDDMSVDIAEVSMSEYTEYIEKCIENGFNVDYDRSEKYFSAKDGNGNELCIQMQIFDVMYIHLKAAE